LGKIAIKYMKKEYPLHEERSNYKKLFGRK